MKKTFLYKATAWMLVGFTVLGATALVIMVLALCGVPMNWWIGALCVIPGCLILVGLAEIAHREKWKGKEALFDNLFETAMKSIEAEEQEEECRFHAGGKCTFGDGLPECVKQLGVIDDAEPQSVMFIQGDFKVIESCEDDMKSYIETSDGLRLIFREGKYVGWYVCGDEGGGKDG